jgi:ATP-dependent DNA ligase
VARQFLAQEFGYFFEPRDMFPGLLQMLFDSRLELLILRCPGHFRQRLNKLVFGTVQVFQFVMEEILEGLDFYVLPSRSLVSADARAQGLSRNLLFSQTAGAGALRFRSMPLEIHAPMPLMEALSVDTIPNGEEWQYEPKWDGFRCLALRDGRHVELQSKSEQSLTRYFPELVRAFREVKANRFALDGEIAIPIGEDFSFDALLQRIHPAASRIERLSIETPAIFIAFDLLAGTNGRAIVARPLEERRERLEEFASKYFKAKGALRLSPATTKVREAHRWLAKTGGTLDGVIAKRLDLPYAVGERGAMQKIKNYRSADCVVGGFRYASGKKVVGSLLLGLYDAEGKLNHVGFTSSLPLSERSALTRRLARLIEPPGFTGKAPGGPSRWNRGRSSEWTPLRPKLVVEVRYDHVTGGRFRHGTGLVRWRPDKAPSQCRMDQLKQSSTKLVGLL